MAVRRPHFKKFFSPNHKSVPLSYLHPQSLPQTSNPRIPESLLLVNRHRSFLFSIFFKAAAPLCLTIPTFFKHQDEAPIFCYLTVFLRTPVLGTTCAFSPPNPPPPFHSLMPPGSHHGWHRDCSFPSVAALRTYVPHLPGHAEEYNDHQGVPPPLLLRLHRHSPEKRVTGGACLR